VLFQHIGNVDAAIGPFIACKHQGQLLFSSIPSYDGSLSVGKALTYFFFTGVVVFTPLPSASLAASK
jgi:hypothetical protein